MCVGRRLLHFSRNHRMLAFPRRANTKRECRERTRVGAVSETRDTRTWLPQSIGKRSQPILSSPVKDNSLIRQYRFLQFPFVYLGRVGRHNVKGQPVGLIDSELKLIW